VSSSCQIFFKWQLDEVSSGSHIKVIVVLKLFIREQEERIRIHEKLVFWFLINLTFVELILSFFIDIF